MTKAEFKRRLALGKITYDDVADCAVAWGVTSSPRTSQINRVTYQVVLAAGVPDAEEWNPDTWEEDDDEECD